MTKKETSESKEENLWDPYAGLMNQVAIVTGGGRGLGKWIALGLAQAGTDVVVASRTLSECEEVAESIRTLGRRSLAIRIDVSVPADCEKLVAITSDEFKKLNILVNNAGGGKTNSTLDVREDEFDQIVATNFKGAFFCSQAAARVMIHNGGGCIINIGSTAGHLIRPATPPQAVYSAAKSAVSGLTRALAYEWADKDIRVNCVAPGLFATPATSFILSSPNWVSEFMRTTPLGRVGYGPDIVGAVLFFASEQSRFVTGQTLFADGGRTIL
jgi:NAD(P)-dependent dehydrogenase (short-subunit alcohol dehydrogenase family)